MIVIGGDSKSKTGLFLGLSLMKRARSLVPPARLKWNLPPSHPEGLRFGRFERPEFWYKHWAYRSGSRTITISLGTIAIEFLPYTGPGAVTASAR
jgi:hypothetical protein